MTANPTANQLHDAMVAHISVGELLLDKKDIRGAMGELEQALVLARRTVAAEPAVLRSRPTLG